MLPYDDMNLVLGLCNPGEQYTRTLHNIGKMAVDILCAHLPKLRNKTIDYYQYNDWTFAYSNSEHINNSGLVVSRNVQKLVIIYDEVMLPQNVMKLQYGGSAKGHNGLRSIIAHARAEFGKVRIGVGHPGKGSDLSKYLLTPCTKDMLELILTPIYALTLEQFIQEINSIY